MPEPTDSVKNAAEMIDNVFLGQMKPMNEGNVLYSMPKIIITGNINHSRTLCFISL